MRFDLSVSLLRVLHAKWLECEKSLGIDGFIPSFMPLLVKMGQQCCGNIARLFPFGDIQEDTNKASHTPATSWDGSFGRFDKGTAEILISLLNISGTRRC